MRAPAFLILAAGLSGAEFRFVPEGRPLRIEVEKLGLMAGKKHVFEFPAYAGSLAFDPAAPAGSSVTLEVETGEFRLLDTWVSEKERKIISEFTRSAEMLHTAKYPKLAFRGGGGEKTGEGAYRVSGQLTIRGVTKPVILEVRSRQEGAALFLAGRAVFALTAFGLKPPSALLGVIRTKDEIKLQFEVMGQ